LSEVVSPLICDQVSCVFTEARISAVASGYVEYHRNKLTSSAYHVVLLFNIVTVLQ